MGKQNSDAPAPYQKAGEESRLKVAEKPPDRLAWATASASSGKSMKARRGICRDTFRRFLEDCPELSGIPAGPGPDLGERAIDANGHSLRAGDGIADPQHVQNPTPGGSGDRPRRVC